MSYVPASSSADLWAVLGGLLAAALGLGWWVRRADREDEGAPGPDAPGDQGVHEHPMDPTGHEPGPRNGASAA
jgi:hypothetical protein